MVVLVAVAPAVWRNWAAIRLALGRIYSDFRDYPEMVDIHPQHRGGREDEAASILASTGKPRGRITVGVPAKTGSPGDCGRWGFYFDSETANSRPIDNPKKKTVNFDPNQMWLRVVTNDNFFDFEPARPFGYFPRPPGWGECQCPSQTVSSGCPIHS